MIDPDSPSRTDPSNREFAHWLVGNIPGKHVEQGEVLVEYLSTFPRSGTGFHRYIFLLYQQHCHNDYSEVPRVSRKWVDSGVTIVGFSTAFCIYRNRTPRLRFSVREFAHRYSLGHPIAGNFFVAQFDDYVPVILSQFPASTEY